MEEIFEIQEYDYLSKRNIISQIKTDVVNENHSLLHEHINKISDIQKWIEHKYDLFKIDVIINDVEEMYKSNQTYYSNLIYYFSILLIGFFGFMILYTIMDYNLRNKYIFFLKKLNKNKNTKVKNKKKPE